MKNDIFLDAIAHVIEKSSAQFYNQPMGFALIIFPFNDLLSDYVSNAQRDDMIKVLRETADRIEKNDIIGKTIGEA